MCDNLDKKKQTNWIVIKKASPYNTVYRKKVILIDQLYIVLMAHFNHYKQILPIQVF